MESNGLDLKLHALDLDLNWTGLNKWNGMDGMGWHRIPGRSSYA